MSRQVIFIVICLLISSFFLLSLANRDKRRADERLYLDISKTMVESGDWMVPRNEAGPRFTKPPLYYWLVALSYKVFGFNHVSGRLISCVSALGIILLCFFFGQMLGLKHLYLAPLLMASNVYFFRHAGSATMETLQVFFIALAFLCFLKRRYMLFFLAVGLGVFAKGYFTLIVTFGSVLLYSLAARRADILKEIPWLRGGGLIALIVLPWFIYMHFQFPERFAGHVLGEQVLDRIRLMIPQAYFFKATVLRALPWSVFFLLALPGHWRRGLLFVSWFVMGAVFLELFSQHRISRYYFSAHVPMMLLAALYIDGMKSSVVQKVYGWSWSLLCGVLAIVSIVAWIYMGQVRYDFSPMNFNPLLIISAGFSVLGLLTMWLWRRQWSFQQLIACHSILILSFFSLFFSWAKPSMGTYRAITKEARGVERILSFDVDDEVRTHRESFAFMFDERMRYVISAEVLLKEIEAYPRAIVIAPAYFWEKQEASLKEKFVITKRLPHARHKHAVKGSLSDIIRTGEFDRLFDTFLILRPR